MFFNNVSSYLTQAVPEIDHDDDVQATEKFLNFLQLHLEVNGDGVNVLRLFSNLTPTFLTYF